MNIVAGLQNKNNTEAYQLLLLLEKESAESDALYGNFEDFVGLLKNKSSFVRTRGFRLACAQARWDVEDKLAANMEMLLDMLDDEKPTAVRQCLEALQGVVRYKPQLVGDIEKRLDTMDLKKYKDSMRPLIVADMAALRELYGKESVT